jgi:hypothetical protein
MLINKIVNFTHLNRNDRQMVLLRWFNFFLKPNSYLTCTLLSFCQILSKNERLEETEIYLFNVLRPKLIDIFVELSLFLCPF